MVQNQSHLLLVDCISSTQHNDITKNTDNLSAMTFEKQSFLSFRSKSVSSVEFNTRFLFSCGYLSNNILLFCIYSLSSLCFYEISFYSHLVLLRYKISDVEYLFICLLAICVSFLEIPILKFSHFFNQSVFSFLFFFC